MNMYYAAHACSHALSGSWPYSTKYYRPRHKKKLFLITSILWHAMHYALKHRITESDRITQAYTYFIVQWLNGCMGAFVDRSVNDSRCSNHQHLPFSELTNQHTATRAECGGTCLCLLAVAGQCVLCRTACIVCGTHSRPESNHQDFVQAITDNSELRSLSLSLVLISYLDEHQIEKHPHSSRVAQTGRYAST